MRESRLNAIGAAKLSEEGAGHWPSRSVWRAFYLASIFLTAEWVVVYGGANWITGLHSHRVEVQTSLDRALPFMPSAAFFYLSLFPMLWLSPFVLRSAAQLRTFARSLAIVIMISGIGFLLVPAEAMEAPSIGSSPFASLFHFADTINLNHNYFPSLHVGMAIVCAIYYSGSFSRTAALFFSMWALMIALATLLTRQHYVVDVFAGGALGAMVAKRFTFFPALSEN